MLDKVHYQACRLPPSLSISLSLPICFIEVILGVSKNTAFELLGRLNTCKSSSSSVDNCTGGEALVRQPYTVVHAQHGTIYNLLKQKQTRAVISTFDFGTIDHM